MRKLGVLSLALAFSGCLAGSPLAPGDPETVDGALIGKWRCIGFDDDAEVGILTVARKDPKTYEVEASGEPRPSKWEAFTVKVEKDRFINVRDLDSSNDEPWTLLRFTLYRPNLLYLEAVRYEAWKARRRDFQKALLDASTRETLFEDYLSCVRTDKR
jgi:hypothetical protein